MSKKLASPLARSFAKANGINIEDVKGSGELGRIKLDDVNKLATTLRSRNQLRDEKRGSIASKQSQLLGKTIPHSQIRKAIAKAMINSQSSVAYVSLLFECNATKLWDYRKQIIEKTLKEDGIKITFLPLIMRAFALALEEYPLFGSKLSSDGENLIYPSAEEINITVAVDTEYGLMVPVVKNVNKKSLVDIQRDINELAKKARERKINTAEMRGGCFAISNYGSVGAITGTPIINYPELAIAGVGIIKDYPYFRGKEFYQGKLLPLTIAADHRWIDGADIGRFAKRVIEYLEDPISIGGV